MSYGCAKRRDERRQVAISAIEKRISLYENTSLPQAKANLKKAAADKSNEPFRLTVEECQAAVIHYSSKLAIAKIDLANTRANLGKGTTAMAVKAVSVGKVAGAVNSKGNFTEEAGGYKGE